MHKTKTEFMQKAAQAVLVGLTLLSFVKAVLISLDIDESYAVALGYRLATGDRLVRDMWEPHQFSSFLAALVTYPYIRLRGNTDYLVIYLRLAGIVIHTLFGAALYRQLSKKGNRLFAFFMVILHLNFLPKWVQMPEFELMHYWCLLGIFLVFHAYFTSVKRSLLFPAAGGVFLACSVLCYPTMVLLYPFYILALLSLEKQYPPDPRKLSRWRSSALFTLGAALTGVLFLVYIFRSMSPEEFLRYLSYIFLDTSHGVYTMGEKWLLYLDQLRTQGLYYAFYLLAAAALVLVPNLIYRGFPRGGSRQKAAKTFPLPGRSFAIAAILITAGFLMQIRFLFGILVEDQNQFFFQIRYLALVLPALFLSIRHYHRMAVWLQLCLIPGLLSVIAVSFVTNMDTNVSYAKAFLGVLGSFFIFHEYLHGLPADSPAKKLFSLLQYLTGGTLLLGFLACRLILIRVTGCLPVTVLAPMEQMTLGPEKGIYVLKDTARVWNDNYRELDTCVNRDDKVLYIGAESLIYVKLEALLSTPSTQGTVVYNEMFLYYYEEHPERLPNVVIFDKTFAEKPEYSLYYGFSLQNAEFFEWLKSNYSHGERTETDHLIIIRKE